MLSGDKSIDRCIYVDGFFVFLNCVWSLVRFVYVSIKLRFKRIDAVINVANGLLELIDESDVARARIPTIPETRASGDSVSKGATNAMAVAPVPLFS